MKLDDFVKEKERIWYVTRELRLLAKSAGTHWYTEALERAGRHGQMESKARVPRWWSDAEQYFIRAAREMAPEIARRAIEIARADLRESAQYVADEAQYALRLASEKE